MCGDGEGAQVGQVFHSWLPKLQEWGQLSWTSPATSGIPHRIHIQDQARMKSHSAEPCPKAQPSKLWDITVVGWSQSVLGVVCYTAINKWHRRISKFSLLIRMASSLSMFRSLFILLKLRHTLKMILLAWPSGSMVWVTHGWRDRWCGSSAYGWNSVSWHPCQCEWELWLRRIPSSRPSVMETVNNILVLYSDCAGLFIFSFYFTKIALCYFDMRK